MLLYRILRSSVSTLLNLNSQSNDLGYPVFEVLFDFFGFCVVLNQEHSADDFIVKSP